MKLDAQKAASVKHLEEFKPPTEKEGGFFVEKIRKEVYRMIPYMLLYMIGVKLGMSTAYNVLIGVGFTLKVAQICWAAFKTMKE